MLELICFLTGYGVLKAISLGKWNYIEGRDAIAVFAGILFWVIVIGVLAACLLLYVL